MSVIPVYKQAVHLYTKLRISLAPNVQLAFSDKLQISLSKVQSDVSEQKTSCNTRFTQYRNVILFTVGSPKFYIGSLRSSSSSMIFLIILYFSNSHYSQISVLSSAKSNRNMSHTLIREISKIFQWIKNFIYDKHCSILFSIENKLLSHPFTLIEALLSILTK